MAGGVLFLWIDGRGSFDPDPDGMHIPNARFPPALCSSEGNQGQNAGLVRLQFGKLESNLANCTCHARNCTCNFPYGTCDTPEGMCHATNRTRNFPCGTCAVPEGMCHAMNRTRNFPCGICAASEGMCNATCCIGNTTCSMRGARNCIGNAPGCILMRYVMGVRYGAWHVRFTALGIQRDGSRGPRIRSG